MRAYPCAPGVFSLHTDAPVGAMAHFLLRGRRAAGNKLGAAGGASLAEALKVNATLQTLHLYGALLAVPPCSFLIVASVFALCILAPLLASFVRRPFRSFVVCFVATSRVYPLRRRLSRLCVRLARSASPVWHAGFRFLFVAFEHIALGSD